MACFLVKSDPDEYSCDDLERDGETIWDGVHSNPAILQIRAMKPGDQVYVYHSISDKAVVGLAKVIGEPFENKDDPRYSWAVKLVFVKRFKNPVNLAAMKAEPSLQDFALIRQPRLSVMAVPEAVQKWLNTRLS